MQGLFPEAYQPFAPRIFASLTQADAMTAEADVAQAVWRAANDCSGRSGSLRVPTPWRWPGGGEPSFDLTPSWDD